MNNSQLLQFIEQSNVQMLWDVLRETEIYDKMNIYKRGEFQQSVLGNINKFYSVEKTSQTPSKNLIEMNKKFIEIMINNLSNQSVSLTVNPELPPLKLKQNNAYTSKDIQTERQAEFENSLNIKRQDFDNTINIKKPPVPIFSDNLDEPIREMESLIAQTIAQRNFEIDQIQSVNSMNNSNNDFLMSKETSLKTEKQRDYEQTLKYIKIEKEEIGQHYDNSEVIDLNKNQHQNPNQNKAGKKIIINERDNETYYYDNENSIVQDKPPNNNIFLKLKPAAVQSFLQPNMPKETKESKENIKITFSDITPNNNSDINLNNNAKITQNIQQQLNKLSEQIEEINKAMLILTNFILQK